MATVDHRRAVADRNRAAIMDASERLLEQRQPLSMAAVASEAGVSRPTLYAHFKTLADVLEAAVERVVTETCASIEAADPDSGPADAAVERMLNASWSQLATVDALARGAAEHLTAAHLNRAHAPLMQRVFGVIERGRREGVFRDDLPALWLVHSYVALIHSANDLARSGELARDDVLTMLKTTISDLLKAR